jgi:hypothetical protein
MKRIFTGFLTIFILAVAVYNVLPQTKQTTTERLNSEITKLRSDLVKAIKERDRKSLETLYAADFTHTHASGQVDDKTKRIDTLASGEPTIESAAVEEMNVRFYGKTTAVANGQSGVKNRDESTTEYRWTIVYVKTGKTWQIVASQATRLAEK